MVALSAVSVSQAAVNSMHASQQARGSHVAGRTSSRSNQLDLRSSSALVFDEGSKSILFARNANVALPIASITKLMTAIVILDVGQPLDEVIELTHADRDGERGSASRLPLGAKLTRGDLMHVALMSSDNRAAHAIGRSYPGGLPAMVRAMNLKAQALGMTQTHFVDATGLSASNVASSQDLAKLVTAASQLAKIREYSTDDKYELGLGRRAIQFRNTNSLVNKSDWDIIVQKTGYTNEAGKCLVMKTIINDRSLVIVLLDSFGKYTRVADARRIKKWLQAMPDSATQARR